MNRKRPDEAVDHRVLAYTSNGCCRDNVQRSNSRRRLRSIYLYTKTQAAFRPSCTDLTNSSKSALTKPLSSECVHACGCSSVSGNTEYLALWQFHSGAGAGSCCSSRDKECRTGISASHQQ